MSLASRWSPAGPGLMWELYRRNRVLCLVTLSNLALAVVFTGLMALDGRTLLGRNVWTKPWKFATSIAIFTGTMGWVLPSLSLTQRVERLATYVIGGAMTIEIALISTQAARGVASHHNTSTPLDSSIFVVMGVTITISSVVVAYVLWRVVSTPPSLAPAYLWGLGLGMFIFVVASCQGWLMVAQGGHTVGTAAGGPGLPLVNWSLTGGDLRIAHFVGLHALQVLPLTGYVAARWERASDCLSLGVVGVVGTLYGLVTLAAFVQALLGVPVVRSSPVTVPASAVAAVLLVASVCVAVGIERLDRRGDGGAVSDSA